jgi:sec-independent protein translocase protein TatA
MSIGVWQVVLVLAIVLILFGAGKLPRVMGDLAKGIKTFKSGMKDEIADAGASPADEAKRPEPAAARPDDNARG